MCPALLNPSLFLVRLNEGCLNSSIKFLYVLFSPGKIHLLQLSLPTASPCGLTLTWIPLYTQSIQAFHPSEIVSMSEKRMLINNLWNI